MANYNTLKVEGFESLIKDVDTKAIINTNRSEYNSYMVRVKSRETNSDTIRSLCKEINILKQELFEIKKELENKNNKKG